MAEIRIIEINIERFGTLTRKAAEPEKMLESVGLDGKKGYSPEDSVVR